MEYIIIGEKVEMLTYINEKLFAYAMAMTGRRYDAEDFVQETAARFFEHREYQELSIAHQKNIAKKIMRNLFLLSDLHNRQQKILRFKAWNKKQFAIPGDRIDFNALQRFLKERQDYQINVFWLWNIGYTGEELMQMFSLGKNTCYGMIREGRKKLIKIIEGAFTEGKEGTRLNWNKRRTAVPFVPL